MLIGVSSTAEAAQAVNPRGRTTSGTESSTASDATRTSTATARSATTARSAVSTRSATSSSAGTAARAATAGRTTVSRTPTTATSSTTSAARSATVTARAGTTQKVLNAGTTINAANENVMVSEACRQKYYGCMDSFCMLDNDSGGRCICSDKNAEYDEILAQIEELDQQSYQMATYGVESIEKSYDVNLIKDIKAERPSVDLSLWTAQATYDDNEESVSALLDRLKGAELYKYADDICVGAIPECDAQLSMLRLMYNQQIKNDCSAYENSLNKQKQASRQKLEAAKSALIDASYTSLQSANKYDLGQCTVEFKNCMISTGGCGDDFSGCASIAAFDSTSTRGNKNASTYEIQGTVTSIKIQASTYDILLSKKPLCESVTKQCQLVADQVWDTFLKEVAPQVKSAELIAEDNARQSCVGNISSCFQQACKDTMDPKDPEGSYDLCLTRPEAMLNFGISTTSASKAQESEIWDFVVARLASMRVNSCTTEFKECLQSEDRCGEDYTKCIGLDTDTIIRMCPYDKLVGCQKVYGGTDIRADEVYDELYNVAQGIFLDIDNNMLEYCESALNEAIVEACGDTDTCNKFTLDAGLGTRSLEYKICDYALFNNYSEVAYANCRTDLSQVTDEELGRVQGASSGELGPVTPIAGIIDGTIYWDGVEIDESGNISTVDDYFENIGITNVSDAEKEMVAKELGVLQLNLEAIYNLIESDPTVQFCMTGREVQGIKPFTGESKPRFPELTKSTRKKIATNALNSARMNYYKRYDELDKKLNKDYIEIGERIAEIRGENAKDARREIARQACVNLAENSALPKSPAPKSLVGQITAIVAVVAAAIVVSVFTFGAGAIAMGAAAAAGAAAMSSAGATAAAAMGAAAAGASSAAVAAAAAGSAAGAAIAATSAAVSSAVTAATAASLAASAVIAPVVGTVGAAALVAGTTAQLAVDYVQPQQQNTVLELSGRYENNQWNYRETITTDFNMETLVCHKCVTTQNCTSIRTPFFGSKSCKKWAEPEPVTCEDIQF